MMRNPLSAPDTRPDSCFFWRAHPLELIKGARRKGRRRSERETKTEQRGGHNGASIREIVLDSLEKKTLSRTTNSCDVSVGYSS